MTPQFSEAIPLSLYIHLPWCVKKCPYCDFNSHQGDPQNIPEDEYVAALLRDLETGLPSVWGRTVSSIFIGGGTPSLFSAEAIKQLLTGVRTRLPLLPDIEITLEANPGTAEQARFSGYREAGVNRLSLGIQSFHTPSLQRLGRIHDADHAHRAIEMAKQAGFDNFNLDLMFGLPEQSPQASLEDLHQAIQHAPSHISFYQLTLEPNTLFHHQPPTLPDSEILWQMQVDGARLLGESGFEQYEVSAFATTGRGCRHNRNYWEFGDYLGIGAGAHGKITDMNLQQAARTTRQRHPERYLNSPNERISSTHKLTGDELMFEFMLNALRLNHGFSQAIFEQRTGLAWESVAQEVRMLIEEGLMQQRGDVLLPTKSGRQFLNDLISRFLPDEPH